MNAAVAVVFLMVLALVGLPLLLVALLVSSIIGLVVLQKGVRVAASVLMWMLLPLLVSLYLGRSGKIDFILLHSLLVCLFIVTYQRFQSWTLVLECMTLLAVVAVAIAHAVVPDLAGFWTRVFTELLHKLKALEMPISAEEMKVFFKAMGSIATGIFAFFELLLILFSLIFSVALSKRSGLSAVGKDRFTQIRVGAVSLLMAVLVFALSFLKMPVAFDLSRLVIFPFMVGGASVVQYFIEDLSAAPIILAAFYLSFLFFGITMLVACLLGFIDMAFNLRQRFAHLKIVS